MKPTSPQIALEAGRIAAALAALPVGGVLPYEEASRLIGRDVRGPARFALIKARRQAEAETGHLFEAVRGEGLRRLGAAHVAGVGLASRRRIGRAAKRGFERLSRLSYNDLEPPARAAIDRERSLLGAIHGMASQPTARKVDALLAEPGTTGPVTLAEIARALK